jgi:hypothetical protein
VVLIPEHNHLRRRRLQHQVALDAERICSRLNWRGPGLRHDSPARQFVEARAGSRFQF